jgi:hypothetical protein
MVRKPVTTRSSLTHPRLASELAGRVARWRRLSDADQDSIVDEAVASMLERGYWILEAGRTASGQDALLGDDLANAYLDGAGVGDLLGVDRKTALSYRLPPHEAQIGRVRGWRTSTILRWNAARPRLTEGVDVEIRNDLESAVRRYEAKAGRDIPMAEWLVMRERLIAKRPGV